MEKDASQRITKRNLVLALVALGTMLLASVGIILCNYGDQSRAVSVAWVEQQLLIPCKSLQVAHCQAIGESVSILLKEPPPEQFFDDLVTAGWKENEDDENGIFERIADHRIWKIMYTGKSLVVWPEGDLIDGEWANMLQVPGDTLQVDVCVAEKTEGRLEIRLKAAPGQEFFAALKASGWREKDEGFLYERVIGDKLMELVCQEWEDRIDMMPVGDVVSVQSVEDELHFPDGELRPELCLRDYTHPGHIVLRLKSAPTEDFYRTLQAAGWRRCGDAAFFVRNTGDGTTVLFYDAENGELRVSGKLREISMGQVEQKYYIPTQSLSVLASCERKTEDVLHLYVADEPTKMFEMDLLGAGWEKLDNCYRYTAMGGNYGFLLHFDRDDKMLVASPWNATQS